MHKYVIKKRLGVHPDMAVLANFLGNENSIALTRDKSKYTARILQYCAEGDGLD